MPHPQYRVGLLSELIEGFDAGVSVNGEDRPSGPDEHGVLKVSAVGIGRFIPGENKAILARDTARMGPSIRAGDLLVTRANTHDLVGAAALVSEDFPWLHLSDKTWRARLRSSDHETRRWLAHVLTSPAVRSELRRRASGTSGSMKNISQSAYLGIRVATPPQELRGKLADVLDTITMHESIILALLAAKRRFRRGLMQPILTGETRFRQFRSPWRTATVGSLFEAVSRPIDWDESATYELLSIRRRSGGVFVRGRKLAQKIATKTLFEAHAGDVLISKMQALHGAIGIVKPEHHGMKVSGSYIALRPKTDGRMMPAFFAWLTRLPHMYRAVELSSHGVHIEKMTFSLDWYLRTRVSVPDDEEEQTSIVALLDALEREETLLAAMAEAAERQKRGLLDNLLSGELRPAPE